MNKGKFSNGDICEAVKICEDNDVQVIANYVLGLDGETEDDFKATQDMAIELNTAYVNVYQYVDYDKNPDGCPYEGGARDAFFVNYFTRSEYQGKILRLFGPKGLQEIERMLDARMAK